MRVIHSSLHLFVNSSPVLFPEIDRRLGVIARQDERTGTITVETESPSFVSTVDGEKIDSGDDDDGVNLPNVVDSLVRSRLLSLAIQCDKTAAELSTHAARFRKIVAQKTVVDEISSSSNTHYHRHPIVVAVAPTVKNSIPTPSTPSRSRLNLEDI